MVIFTILKSVPMHQIKTEKQMKYSDKLVFNYVILR